VKSEAVNTRRKERVIYGDSVAEDQTTIIAVSMGAGPP
jgi:hypothetical protein